MTRVVSRDGSRLCAGAVLVGAGDRGGTNGGYARNLDSRAWVRARRRGRVVVATFPTTIGGEDVQYRLLMTNGCSDGGTISPPVGTLEITLNGDVVFQQVGDFRQTVDVDLEPVSGASNQLVALAQGSPGAGASFVVVALSPMPIGGRSVLPWAWTDSLTKTFLTIHNAGPSNLAYRLTFLRSNGSEVCHPASRSRR